MEERMLTGRGAARILRVARTVADLADAPDVTVEHLSVAAHMREDLS